MSVVEYEVGRQPGPPERKRIEVDPITLRVLGGALQQVPTRYYERAALRAGNRLVGPAIVTQYDSTTVIPPGLAAHVDRFGNIVIAIAESAERESEATEMEVAA